MRKQRASIATPKLNPWPFTHATTFGGLPIGAMFERNVWDRDPADRRRKILVRWRYIKTTQGTQAGFAQGVHGDWRADNRWPVFIDVSDHRVLVAAVRAQHQQGSASSDILCGMALLFLTWLTIVTFFALLGR